MVLHRLVACSTFARIAPSLFKEAPYHGTYMFLRSAGINNSFRQAKLSTKLLVRIYHAISSHRHPSSVFVRLHHHAFFTVRTARVKLNTIQRFGATIAREQHAFEARTDFAHGQRKIVGLWLAACALTSAAALTVGGLVRLHKAGTTITRWELVSGILPPTSDGAWREAFDRYRQSPEFRYLHANDMSLEQFKNKYWLVYTHRLMGRLVGALFFVPAALFWHKGRFNKLLKLQVAGVGSLLASQAVLGWLMVRSSLVERRPDNPNDLPRMDQNLVCAHFGTGLLLIAGFTFMSQNLLRPATVLSHTVPAIKLTRALYAAYACACIAYTNSLSGSYVAGLDAGLLYGTFPKFSGEWFPKGDFISDHMPRWRNFFDNPTFCQFRHRLLAVLTGTTVLTTWACYRKYMVTPAARALLAVAVLTTVAQIGLGITTLVKNVPVEWAEAHQTNNTILMVALTLLIHELHWLRRAVRK